MARKEKLKRKEEASKEKETRVRLHVRELASRLQKERGVPCPAEVVGTRP